MSTAAPKTLSVLLVEDSLADGRLLLEALKPAVNAGELLVQTVKRLSQATEELKRFDFSCVLLDLGLPDGQGVDNVRTLRAVDQRPAIIVLTGLNDERAAVEALKLGAQDYLLKGETDADQLLKLIRRAIQRNRQTVQLEHQRDSAYFAATREPLTLLPNLPLLLELTRQQQAERAGQPALSLGVLMIDGLNEFRARAGVTLADAWLRDAAQAMSELLRPADTLASIAPGCFVLLPRPAVDAQALPALMAPLLGALDRLQAQRSSALRWRLTSCELQDGQGIEQALNESLERAAAPPVEARPPVTLPAGSLSGDWLVWVDTQSLRCAGALWAEPAPAADLAGTVLPAWLHTAQALQAQSATTVTNPVSEPLALSMTEACWGAESALVVAGIRKALAGSSVTDVSLAVLVPQAVLAADHPALVDLRGGGVKLLMGIDPVHWPSFASLSRWPLQALLLPAAQWQRVLDDNLRGPSRRALDALLGAAQALGTRVVATGVDEPSARDALRLVGVRWMQGAALLPCLKGEMLCQQWSVSVELPR